jgi:ribosomal protein S18 acetylase RimI-like enzyme
MELSMLSRNYENETDFQKMRAFLIDARRVTGHYAGYWHIGGGLTWCTFLMSFRVHLRANIRLWEDRAGALVGFAIFGDDFSMDLQVRPDARWQGIEEKMFAWAETRWRESMDDPTIPQERTRDLFARVLVDDAPRIAFLERHGFTRGDKPFLRFVRSLADPIPDPVLPDDFVVRGVAGENEITNRASAHREAFHPSRITDEGYARLMRMSEYARDLDVVAVAPDGTIAAYAMAWVDRANKVSEFEPVGTRPAFQRKGLARAALLEGMKRMKARGAETALVSASGSETGAIRLYESVGFRHVNTEVAYIKPYPQPPSLIGKGAGG